MITSAQHQKVKKPTAGEIEGAESEAREQRSSFDVEAALDEVTQKGEQQIEEETAHKWASRAIACYLLYQQTAKVDWLLQGDSYRHEAIEHAALVKDAGGVYREVMEKMEKYRNPRKEAAAPSVLRGEAYHESRRQQKELVEATRQQRALPEQLDEVRRESQETIERIKREVSQVADTRIREAEHMASARIITIEQEHREREAKILEAATRPINVHPPAVHIDAPRVSVAPAEVKVDVHLPPRADQKVEYDQQGRIIGLTSKE